MTDEGIGTQMGAKIGTKNTKTLVMERIGNIRSAVVVAEETYYSFRDDIEEQLQRIKYQLDKLEQMEKNNDYR